MVSTHQKTFLTANSKFLRYLSTFLQCSSLQLFMQIYLGALLSELRLNLSCIAFPMILGSAEFMHRFCWIICNFSLGDINEVPILLLTEPAITNSAQEYTNYVRDAFKVDLCIKHAVHCALCISLKPFSTIFLKNRYVPMTDRILTVIYLFAHPLV